MSDTDKFRDASPPTPAAEDPQNRTPDGRFRKGNRVGAGVDRKALGLLVRTSRRYHQQQASETEIKDVADALGLEPYVVVSEIRGRLDDSDVPVQVGHLIVFLQNRLALRGGIEAFREVFDRTEPKPKRIEVSADGVAIRAALSASDNAGEREAAEDYFDGL